VAASLGLFVLVAGLILWFTAHERTGATLLVILSIGLFYIARVTRGGAHPAEEGTSAASEVGAEEAVAPTIWPFGFSVAAVGLVLGVVVARWLLVVGGALVVACGAGWYRDIRRQHAHGSEHEHAPAEGADPGVRP
jgi:hypothetical protein